MYRIGGVVHDQIWNDTCGYCKMSNRCKDLQYSNFMDEINIYRVVFQKDQKE